MNYGLWIMNEVQGLNPIQPTSSTEACATAKALATRGLRRWIQPV